VKIVKKIKSEILFYKTSVFDKLFFNFNFDPMFFLWYLFAFVVVVCPSKILFFYFKLKRELKMFHELRENVHTKIMSFLPIYKLFPDRVSSNSSNYITNHGCKRFNVKLLEEDLSHKLRMFIQNNIPPNTYVRAYECMVCFPGDGDYQAWHTDRGQNIMVLALHDVGPENGMTEYKSSIFPRTLKAGDFFFMDGTDVHRGVPNPSAETRIICHILLTEDKKLKYNDKDQRSWICDDWLFKICHDNRKRPRVNIARMLKEQMVPG
jgi:hypothetical protein